MFDPESGRQRWVPICHACQKRLRLGPLDDEQYFGDDEMDEYQTADWLEMEEDRDVVEKKPRNKKYNVEQTASANRKRHRSVPPEDEEHYGNNEMDGYPSDCSEVDDNFEIYKQAAPCKKQKLDITRKFYEKGAALAFPDPWGNLKDEEEELEFLVARFCAADVITGDPMPHLVQQDQDVEVERLLKSSNEKFMAPLDFDADMDPDVVDELLLNLIGNGAL